MTFKEKVEKIEAARRGNIEFDEKIKDLLGSGLSTNAVYSSIKEEEIPGYKKTVSIREPKPEPVKTKESAVKKTTPKA